jgi:uncharacterized membrane protein
VKSVRKWLPAIASGVRRPWVLPAMAVADSFIAYFVPPYLTGDPQKARLPNLRKDLKWHYPTLVAHVATGTVAMATVPFLMWPALRENHPELHRLLERAYFYSVIPSGITALAITPLASGPVGNGLGSVLWVAATTAAHQAARLGNVEDERKYMVYSFALCMQIIEGRVMLLTMPHLPNFKPAWYPKILETASWIGIMLNLLAAQLWLDRSKPTLDRATLDKAVALMDRVRIVGPAAVAA